MAAFTAKKVSKVKGVDAESSFSIDGMDNGSFAIASSKKELKQLMTSDAAVVYDEKKGKLYLNENGTGKGWGAKKVGGLIAKFKGKPELSAEQFDGLKLFDDDELTGHTNGDDGDTSMQTKFASRKAAQKAAKNFGCKGAHLMTTDGYYWMPCKDHGAMMLEEDVDSGQDYLPGYDSGYDYYDYPGY